MGKKFKPVLKTLLSPPRGDNDFGLYVGGSTPINISGGDTDTRGNFVAIYERDSNNDLLGVSVIGLADASADPDPRVFTTPSLFGQDPSYDTIFIARDGINDFEIGYYDSGTRIVLADFDNQTGNDGSVVGFYADVRAAENLGGLDNLTVIPEPSSLALMGLGGLLITRRRRRD
ncbi:MAG: PEP-CTERM sorting domain-containing protein [Planctomycetota bacterium]